MGIEARHGHFIARVRLPNSGPTRHIGTYETREAAEEAIEIEYARLRDGSSTLLTAPQSMTIREYAASLNVPYGTVKRWAAEGMPARRVGTLVRVIRDDADPWVAAHHGKSVAFGREAIVYIAQRTSDDAYKIGWTSDVERRMRELRKLERGPVILRAAFPGDKPDELRLHARFADARLDGEWFRATGALAGFIESLRGVAA